MIPPQDEVIDLIHCLGFIYLRHGQPYRAVVLLIVAGQAAPERADILRTLCLALIDAGMGEQALEVLAQLGAMAPDMAAHRLMRLMRARALLLLGRAAEARQCFADAQAGDGAAPGELAA
jgi:type III secretion protein Y